LAVALFNTQEGNIKEWITRSRERDLRINVGK